MRDRIHLALNCRPLFVGEAPSGHLEAHLARMRQVAVGLRLRYQAALAERARIAQELHDTLRDARHMIWDMRAVELEGRDLAEALAAAARQAMANSSAKLVFTVHGQRRPLPLAVETTPFGSAAKQSSTP